MKTCRACGGVLGRDCFNEQDCMAISNSQDSYTNQIHSDLNWQVEVVVPDLEQKIGMALFYIKDLVRIVKENVPSTTVDEYTNQAELFYSEHEKFVLPPRTTAASDDPENLPF